MRRQIALILTLLFLSGCKLAVVVVEGGEVHSTASGICVPIVPGITGSVCIHGVTDTSYFESFTAVPEAGWRFAGWKAGDGFFCGNAIHPTCALSLESFAGNPAVEALVAKDKTYYLMPVFEMAPDTITVNGKEWYQPYLFTNLSAEEIAEVCPGGACTGALNGRDLSGWTWASVNDFIGLANHYAGSTVLGPGAPLPNYTYYGSPLGSPWIKAFYAQGWRDTYLQESPYHILFGSLYGGSDSITALIGEVVNASTAGWTIQDDPYAKDPQLGAWFYRQVP